MGKPCSAYFANFGKISENCFSSAAMSSSATVGAGDVPQPTSEERMQASTTFRHDALAITLRETKNLRPDKMFGIAMRPHSFCECLSFAQE
jgi:hypothetical protein